MKSETYKAMYRVTYQLNNKTYYKRLFAESTSNAMAIVKKVVKPDKVIGLPRPIGIGFYTTYPQLDSLLYD